MNGRPALWVSTSLQTRGGVASCVRTLRATPLGAAWRVRHVATHCDGSAPARVLAFARGALLFAGELLRRPSVVHLHTASYGSFVRKATLGWVAMAFGAPVVLHVHGGEFHLFHDRSPRPMQWWIRTTLTRADAVVALGDRWAVRLRAIAPRARIAVVPNAVRAVELVDQPADGEPVHVVFLGDVCDAKGTFTLLDAWAKAVTQLLPGQARLTVAGGGEVDRARQRVSDLGIVSSVTVRGWIEADGVAALLRSAQVLALPSRAEGQPMVVLEAMANGLCVVASDVGGIPDLVDEGCGVLVAPDDVAELAAALGRVVEETVTRTELGAAALHRVRRQFDVEVVWRQLDALYREVAR